MTLSPSSEFLSLQNKVLDFIHAVDEPGEDTFNELALEVFALQSTHNLPYANFCRSLGGNVSHWSQIPAVPTDAFKHFGTQLSVTPGADFAALFRTSGTTRERSGQRGEHGFADLTLYHASILAAWTNLGLPELPIRFLTPSPADAADSSLAHMMGVLDQKFNQAPSAPFFIDADGKLDTQRLSEALVDTDTPILLAGTALAFLHLLESTPVALPPGSHLLETGGYKGVAVELDKAGFYERLSDRLGVAVDCIHNEYSMTELSSQFYSRGLDRPHRGPHWTRVRIIDPETRQPAEPGETGVIEILDLANLGSCIALRTADLAIAVAASDRDQRNPDGAAFTLLGRDPAALPRGCSRSADEMLAGPQHHAERQDV